MVLHIPFKFNLHHYNVVVTVRHVGRERLENRRVKAAALLNMNSVNVGCELKKKWTGCPRQS